MIFELEYFVCLKCRFLHFKAKTPGENTTFWTFYDDSFRDFGLWPMFDWNSAILRFGHVYDDIVTSYNALILECINRIT